MNNLANPIGESSDELVKMHQAVANDHVAMAIEPALQVDNLTSQAFDNAEVTPAIEAEDEAPQCPGCGSTTPWGMSSWCPECGYYPAISSQAVNEVQEEKVDDDETEPPQQWPFFKKLNVGIFAIFVFTMLVRQFYFYADADRGLWTLIQAVAGIVTAGTAQVITTIYASKENHSYSLSSAIINPFDVWGPSFENGVWQNRLCALIWGVTATVLAFAMIGGLTEGHFFKAFKRNKAEFNIVEEIVRATETSEAGDEEDQDANPGLEGLEELQEEADKKEVLSCAIYGFMTSGGEDITRVLLAAEKEGVVQHVGILTAEQLGQEKTAALNNIFKTLEMPSTEVKTSFVAQWVEPSFTIAVEHDGFDAFGNLQNARLPEKKEDKEDSDD